MRQDQRPPGAVEETDGAMNFLFVLVQVHIKPLEVILLRVPGTAGELYLGTPHAGLAIFWLPIFGILCGLHTDRELLPFLVAAGLYILLPRATSGGLHATPGARERG